MPSPLIYELFVFDENMAIAEKMFFGKHGF